MKKLVVGSVLLIVLIAAAVSCSTTPRPAANVGPLPSVPAAAPAWTPSAPIPTVPSGPVTKFGDGTYEVGPDIAAGRYKTPGDGASSCYYARESDDSSGNIIQNDFFKGPGSFTAKKGEFVKVSGGCAWTKQ